MIDYTFGFVLEQTLGHATHSRNLLTNVSDDSSVRALVAPIEFEADGILSNVPLVRNWTIRAGMQARRAVKKMNRSKHVDALFVHTQVPAVLIQNWMKHIPTIVSLDATPLQYDQLGEFYNHSTANYWAEKLKWRANCACFQNAKQIVTWSMWAKHGLINEYEIPAEKIMVLPPGINLDEWQFSCDDASSTGGVKILFVGGDLQRKGGHDLIEAFRFIRTKTAQSTPQVELHVVTHTPIPAEEGMFVYNRMQPNSPELKQLFAQSDLFCLPTYGDCLPLVLAEAGAMGLPLISTDVGAISEVVEHGKTGMLVRPGDMAGLTSALRKLIDNRAMRDAMGERVSRRIRRDHDGKKNAAHLLSLMKELAGPKSHFTTIGAATV